jgi:DNA end-binding protein Ku
MWKGVIRIGDAAVPVKLYASVQDRSVHFDLLHAKDQTPVKQRMVNPKSGREVPYQEIRRGYELARGTFVLLEKSELEDLEPEESRDVEVTRVLPAAAIPDQLYDRPYLLGPDAGGAGPYAALAQALDGKVAVARWVMRSKEYEGALRSEGHYLVLITLRHADAVITADQLTPPAGRKLEQKEVALAEQLVSALEADFDPTRYHDEYRERVLKLIEAKAKGARPKLQLVPKRKPAKASLEGALRASLSRAQREGGRAAS